MTLYWHLWHIWNFAVSWARYLLTGDCGRICGYQIPYGWVPEADCPIHDR